MNGMHPVMRCWHLRAIMMFLMEESVTYRWYTLLGLQMASWNHIPFDSSSVKIYERALRIKEKKERVQSWIRVDGGLCRSFCLIKVLFKLIRSFGWELAPLQSNQFGSDVECLPIVLNYEGKTECTNVVPLMFPKTWFVPLCTRFCAPGKVSEPELSKPATRACIIDVGDNLRSKKATNGSLGEAAENGTRTQIDIEARHGLQRVKIVSLWRRILIHLCVTWDWEWSSCCWRFRTSPKPVVYLFKESECDPGSEVQKLKQKKSDLEETFQTQFRHISYAVLLLLDVYAGNAIFRDEVCNIREAGDFSAHAVCCKH